MPRTSNVPLPESPKKKKSKKPAADEAAEVTLEVVTDASGDSDPMLLASFPEGGLVFDKLELEFARAGPKCLLAGETEELEFKGTNFGRASSSLDTARWCVGVYEPGSETMSLHPVDHIFPMRSSVKGYKRAAPSEAEGAASSAKERRALLFEDFGASKKKRALAASAANVVSSEQALGASALNDWMGSTADAGHAAAAAKEGEGDATDAARDASRRLLLPPFNHKTRDHTKVFDLSTCMVGPQERGALKRQLASLKADAAAGGLGASLGGGWPPVALAAAAGADPEAAAEGLLLRHLVALHLRPNPSFKLDKAREDAAALGMPAEVLAALLGRFAVAQEGGDRGPVRRVTKTLGDKLAIHALVLALKLASFRLRTADVAAAMQMPDAKAAGLLRTAGCKVLADKSAGQVVTLEAPVVFPGRRIKRGN